MLHLFAQPIPEETPIAYAEAVSRLASVRHAMRLVEPFGSGPASDYPQDDEIATAWDDAGEAKQKLFERRSARLIGAAAAGIEALLIERQQGREPNREASEALVEQIRRELSDVAGVVLAS